MDLLKTLGDTLLAQRLHGAPLRVRLWNGQTLGSSREGTAALHLRTPRALVPVALGGPLGIAEAYIRGDIDLEGPLPELIRAVEQSAPAKRQSWRPKAHPRKRDAKAVQFHYDISDDFYRLWLDRNMVYSCAYFRREENRLDEAQEQKLDLICRKLLLRPGERFLDVGCGWGGLAIWAAKHYGVRVTGITISKNQFVAAHERVRAEGLERHCQILFCDYRNLPSRPTFDKIASVGMFEHVGIKNLPAYFGKVSRLLKPGGLMLNHGICSAEPDLSTTGMPGGGEFIERYVFPDAELPHIGTVALEMTRQGLELADVECLRPHYALTLKHWFERLESRRQEAIRIAGERRYRAWRLYLAGCSHAFERGWVSIFQVLSMKRAQDGMWTLPRTREHLYRERAYLSRRTPGGMDQVVA